MGDYYLNNKSKMNERAKKYNEENKERIKAKRKIRDEKNKEKNKIKSKKYREENKEKIKEHNKEYVKKNKEKIRVRKKIYKQTLNGKKLTSIDNWKFYGVKCDDWNVLYELYINTNNCECCKKEFKNTFERCLDHDHITGKFRQILCRGCNNLDSWKKIRQNF